METALGSCFEYETQLICAFDLKYINNEVFEEIEKNIQKIQAMISNFKNTLK